MVHLGIFGKGHSHFLNNQFLGYLEIKIATLIIYKEKKFIGLNVLKSFNEMLEKV